MKLTTKERAALRYLAATPHGAAEGRTRALPSPTVWALVRKGLVRCETFRWERTVTVNRRREWGGRFRTVRHEAGVTVHLTPAGREAATEVTPP